MRAALLVLATVLSERALAEPITRFETELVKGRCRFIADDGEVGHYAEKRCPGLGGARVHTVAGVNRVSLTFRWGKAKAEDVVESWSLGDRLEWRGIGGRAAFKPHATIVQIVVRDHEKDESHNVLGVIRMERRKACLMAVVDEDTNADALTLARTTADTAAPAVRCAKHKPRIVGAPTRWAQELLGLEGDPPE